MIALRLWPLPLLGLAVAACHRPAAAPVPATPATPPSPAATAAAPAPADTTAVAPETTAPETTVTPATPATPAVAAADSPEPPRRLVPGCSEAAAAAALAEIEALDALVTRGGAAGPDPAAFLVRLRTLLTRPCVRHTAAAYRLPAATTAAAIREAWSYGIHSTLQINLYVGVHEDGRRYQTLPYEIVPAVDAATRAKLAPLWCRSNDTSCDRPAAYMMRAEQAFEDQFLHAQVPYRPPPDPAQEPPPSTMFEAYGTDLPAAMCDGTWSPSFKATTFATWMDCVAGLAPRTLRYPAGARFRNLDRGWLVLRGRRGHYQFADELRAYDLATGAAYVVRDKGALLDYVPEPSSEAYTGSVAPDQLRELAFVLLTRPALVPVRNETMRAFLPAALPLPPAAAPPAAPASSSDQWRRPEMWSSNQTSLSFAYTDGAVRQLGSFTWPYSFDGIDTYADQLLRIMEAGLVRGCAPARLPSAFDLRGSPGKVSPVDASPGQLAAKHATLDQRLEALRAGACKDAR